MTVSWKLDNWLAPDINSWKIEQNGQIVCARDDSDLPGDVNVDTECCIDMTQGYTLTCLSEGVDNGFDYVSQFGSIIVNGYIEIDGVRYCEDFASAAVHVVGDVGMIHVLLSYKGYKSEFPDHQKQCDL